MSTPIPRCSYLLQVTSGCDDTSPLSALVPAASIDSGFDLVSNFLGLLSFHITFVGKGGGVIHLTLLQFYLFAGSFPSLCHAICRFSF